MAGDLRIAVVDARHSPGCWALFNAASSRLIGDELIRERVKKLVALYKEILARKTTGSPPSLSSSPGSTLST